MNGAQSEGIWNLNFFPDPRRIFAMQGYVVDGFYVGILASL
jgi:hypothetical protein